MSLQVRLALTGNLEAFAKDVQATLALTARTAVEAFAKRIQLKVRDDTRGALGDKVANAWRINVYPNDATSPAALVYSKAPLIVQAFGQGVTISRNGGLWLAIPTENTPSRGRRPATPAEVEAIYDQDLIFVPSGRGDAALAFVDKGLRGRLKRWRQKGSTGLMPVAKGDRLTLMFVMVRQVHLRKRLAWPEMFKDFQDEWPDFYAEQLAAALKDGT